MDSEPLEIDMVPSGTRRTGRSLKTDKAPSEPKKVTLPTGKSAEATKVANLGSDKPSNDIISWDEVHEDLVEFYTFVADLWEMRDPAMAKILNNRKERMAASWVAKGQTSPKVARFLTGFSSGSGWLGILLAHGPLIMGLAIRSGAIPIGRMPSFGSSSEESGLFGTDGESTGFAGYSGDNPPGTVEGFPPSEPTLFPSSP